MDGNGRWALARGLSRVEGHRKGVEVMRPLVQACGEKGIDILSVFAFSSENWSRPADEVDQLMLLFIESLEREVEALAEFGIRLCFTGERTRLPEPLQTAMASVEALSAHHDRLTFNIVINYGGRWDIVQAIKAIASDVLEGRCTLDSIDVPYVETKLSTYPLPPPDLLIRTGGELRLSNFFLWQAAYSELYFSEVYWPDFTVAEFEKALDSFAVRQRRYGQVGESQVLEVDHA